MRGLRGGAGPTPEILEIDVLSIHDSAPQRLKHNPG
jgi:hypothetical protein